MNLSPEDIRLIDKYIQGHLTENEMRLFQQKLKDPEFKEELEFTQNLKNASVDLKRDKMKNLFRDWDSEDKVPEPKPVIKRLPWKWIGIAASIILLISISIVLWLNDHDSIYKEFYTPFPNLIDPIVKGQADEPSSLTKQYELKNYQNVLRQSAENDIESFYQALAYLALDQTSNAIEILQPLSRNPAFRFQSAAQWYLALAYGFNMQDASCQEILQRISVDSSHEFQQMALDLLENLK